MVGGSNPSCIPKDKKSSYKFIGEKILFVFFVSLYLIYKMNTLKLFNAVISKNSTDEPFITSEGFIIESNALWAKSSILKFYSDEKLNGNDLNKTFHKSWAKIKNSSRFELYLDQIRHYISTYGSDFKDEIYIPDEVLNVPDLKICYKIIKAYTKSEMTEKCLSLLKSGIALKEETINLVLSILTENCDYVFTTVRGIRNKEALIKIADAYNILPDDIMEFFRYIIYRATGQSLLIKSPEVINAILSSNYNPGIQFNEFGLEKLATVFNRFKPLFLGFKSKCGKTINKISKLSKTLHKPMISNPLNMVTTVVLIPDKIHWLDNATPYALFKALSSCHSRIQGQNAFVHRIRNGKSWVREEKDYDAVPSTLNYNRLMDYVKSRFNFNGKRIFLPKNVEFALPTSEKMFVGNIPTGTKFYGKKLVVGIYWENSWGAYDLDLSGLNMEGKTGWNSSYNQNDNLFYSGDMTNAPNGAVEYLHARNGLKDPTLVMNNVYAGDPNCDYKIVIGKGDKISRDYMMNPDKVSVEIKCKSVQRNTILGIIIPEKDRQSFVLLNFGAGHARVSGNNDISDIANKALYQQWASPLSFNKILKLLGAEIVDNPKDAEFDFTLDNLERDSFTKLFSE